MKPDSSKELPLLIYANPEFVSDLFYITGLMTPDPYFAVQIGKELIVAVSPLEYGRAKKGSKATQVIDISSLTEKKEKFVAGGCSHEGANILHVLESNGIQQIKVTRDFPLYLGKELESNGVEVVVLDTSALEARVIKSEVELEHIRDAIRTTEKCHARVEQILRESKIEEGKLQWKNNWLTSEQVQQEIELVCVAHNCLDGNPIVAGGDQGCDPHERGNGILHANQLIIVDIFPRSKTHHYWGDMTRTFLKGTASDEQKKLVATVKAAHQIGIERIIDGVVTGPIHKEIDDYFIASGYKTEIVGGVYQGFFHGTGHGFGLDIHEMPRIGKNCENVLKAGMVVTVEPGLYYPGVGGCRIEDDILVTKEGYEILSNYHYDWIIE